MGIISSISIWTVYLVYKNLGEIMSMSLALIVAFIIAGVVMVKHEKSLSNKA